MYNKELNNPPMLFMERILQERADEYIDAGLPEKASIYYKHINNCRVRKAAQIALIDELQGA